MDTLTIVQGILLTAGCLWLLRLVFTFSTDTKPERQKPKILRYCPTCKKYRGAD